MGGEQLKGDSTVVNDTSVKTILGDTSYKRSLLYHLVHQTRVVVPLCSVTSVAEDC